MASDLGILGVDDLSRAHEVMQDKNRYLGKSVDVIVQQLKSCRQHASTKSKGKRTSILMTIEHRKKEEHGSSVRKKLTVSTSRCVATSTLLAKARKKPFAAQATGSRKTRSYERTKPL